MKKIIYFLYFLPSLAVAQTGVGSNPSTNSNTNSSLTLPNPLKTKSLTELLDGIASFLLTISVVIAGIMVIIAAFQILTSAGNEEKVASGKKTILYTVIGLSIMLLFRVIIALIQKLVGV